MEHTDCWYEVDCRVRLAGGVHARRRHCSTGKQKGKGESPTMVLLEKASSEGPECGGGRDGAAGNPTP